MSSLSSSTYGLGLRNTESPCPLCWVSKGQALSKRLREANDPSCPCFLKFRCLRLFAATATRTGHSELADSKSGALKAPPFQVYLLLNIIQAAAQRDYCAKSSNHPRRDDKLSLLGRFSSAERVTALPTDTEVPMNPTSPPAHSENLNSSLPVHSNPPI